MRVARSQTHARSKSRTGSVFPANRATLAYRPAYIAAWILFVFLLLIALTGSWIKPHDVSEAHTLEIEATAFEPLPPGGAYLLGTELRGLDVLSLLLNGMKYTLGIGLIITIFRFVFALPLGFWSGATSKFRSSLSSLQWVTTALPPLLFMYPLLATLGPALGMGSSPDVTSIRFILYMTIFIGLVTFIGVFPLASQIGERARYYHDQLFVTASTVMGGSLRHRIFKHLAPNMRSEIAYMFLTEFLQVLFLLGQLAVLGIFVGGSTRVYSGDTMQYVTSSTGEWFGLLSYGIQTYRFEPWVILSVSGFFIITVAVFQFFIDQLKKGARRRTQAIDQ